MNCDPLARGYRTLERAVFGSALQRRRLEFLEDVAYAQNVLMLGEGDGRFLAAFLRENPSAHIDYVDSSRVMLSLARERAVNARLDTGSGTQQVRYHHADALAWLQSGPDRAFDLVTLHFFLDCFTTEQLQTLLPLLGRYCTPRARLIVSEFRCPPHGLPRLLARALLWTMYVFFGLATGLKVRQLPDYHEAFVAAGFLRVKQVTAARGLLVSEWWERV